VWVRVYVIWVLEKRCEVDVLVPVTNSVTHPDDCAIFLCFHRASLCTLQ